MFEQMWWQVMGYLPTNLQEIIFKERFIFESVFLFTVCIYGLLIMFETQVIEGHEEEHDRMRIFLSFILVQLLVLLYCASV